MPDDIKPVETNNQPAGTDVGVENTTVAPPVDDAEARYNALIEENARLATERDNYRKGLLKAKAKDTEIDEEPQNEDLEALVARKVQETLLSEKERQIRMEQENLIKNTLRENKELKLALKNKGSMPASSGGSSVETPEVKETFWSPEQEAALKERARVIGVKDFDAYKKNYIKARERFVK